MTVFKMVRLCVSSVAQQQQNWKNQEAFMLFVCCFFFFNIHLVINLTVKEFEIQATKMENLDNSKEAGAGIKSGAAIILRSCLPFFRGKGERHLQ